MSEHQERADRLDDEAEQMQQRSSELGEEIADAREDWKNKVADENVPGTPPAPKDSDDDQDELAPWPDE
ncbi:hypothetical protein OJ998_18285 [Solirubrobacter taibaiensis]|nr:hypothetical protein [Solirubrobacter taibaiensis]